MNNSVFLNILNIFFSELILMKLALSFNVYSLSVVHYIVVSDPPVCCMQITGQNVNLRFHQARLISDFLQERHKYILKGFCNCVTILLAIATAKLT